MEEMNVLYKKGRKANGIGHNLRRNCRVAHVIEVKKKWKEWREDEEENVSS
jgi:hypothetical protein